MAAKKQKQVAEEQLVLTNQFGIPLYIDKKNPSQLRDRVKLLATVVESGKPIGKKRALSKEDQKLAKLHLSWYKAELKKLRSGKAS